MEAALVDVDADNNVTLRKADKSELKVPTSKLSKKDQTYIRGWVRKYKGKENGEVGQPQANPNQLDEKQPDVKTKPHQNKQYRFTIHLPDGWTEMTQAELKQVSRRQFKTSYEAGFQKVDARSGTPQYVLISELPESALPRALYNEFGKAFNERNKELTDLIKKETGIQVEGAPSAPIVDEKKIKVLWLKYVGKGPKGQSMRGYSAHYYRDGKILRFSGATPRAQLKKDTPMLRKILESVELD